MPNDLANVLEAIQAGVLVLDDLGAVAHLNTAASRMLDRPDTGITGQTLENVLGSGHPVSALIADALRTTSSAQASDVTIERRRHPNLLLDAAISPLYDERGLASGAVLVLRDRAFQKRLQELENERERYDSFGRIAAGLAHEVKNPLGGIRGAAELLGHRAGDDKTRKTSALIVREVDRIASLVDDFMGFARGEDLQLGPTNIHEVLDGVLAVVSQDPVSTRTVITREFDPSLPDILADGNRLTQVFLNLILNACQAMEKEGGKLAITTRMTLDHRITTPHGRRVPTLAVGLDDTGPGMTEDVLREATTPFYTTRVGGTGLGLAVAEYWVSQHGGALRLESEVGQGTRALVTLPLRRPDEAAPSEGDER
jgi:two-component system nitrogen regulation sensor histidine kinase GlnL